MHHTTKTERQRLEAELLAEAGPRIAYDDPERLLLAAIADLAWPMLASGPLYEADRPAMRDALAQIRALLAETKES